MSEGWHTRRVLIAGGLGFIGSNLAIELVRRGARVEIVDSLDPHGGGAWEHIQSIAQDVRVRIVDIQDIEQSRDCVRGQDVIYCLAAQVSHVQSMQFPLRDLDGNCRSNLTLLEACRAENRDARVIFTSTRQVYGRTSTQPLTETSPAIPIDINGVHKLAVEHYLRLYALNYEMTTTSLRLANVYGPRMPLNDPSKGFVGVMLGRALRGEPLHVFGSGTQVRDFTFVDDVIAGLILAASLERPRGEVWNLGGDQPLSILDFVRTLAQVLEVTYAHVPFPADYQAIEIGDVLVDSSRFRAATGWQPRTALLAGLQRTCEYFRDLASGSGAGKLSD
jgi:UDP-glucose 4-epimerase